MTLWIECFGVMLVLGSVTGGYGLVGYGSVGIVGVAWVCVGCLSAGYW